jgi:hypothetical protein
VKVLEKAGLVRVVRTRQVRALTEKFYGRVARLFVIKTADADDLRGGGITAMMLRQAADEALASGADELGESGIVRVRLVRKDVVRFQRRLARLVADYHRSADPAGDLHVLSFALFHSSSTLPPRDDA